MKKSEKQKYEYLAFISYQRKDEVIAKRLQHTLEFYNLPIAVIENHPEHPELKDGIRPIFVDMTELGDEPFLKPAIEKALKESRFLIVICSPRSAESKWVNKEVQYFQKLKRTKRIIPFIIEGTPNAQLGDEECCTPLLKKLLGERELLGLNINEMGFDAAAVKVVSRMFRIGFRTLWNRFEMEKEEEQRKEREKKDKLFRLQSRFIADRAKTVATYDSYLARRLAVEVLPENIDNPNRPYVPEAEAALRYSSYQSNTILRGHDNSACSVVYSPDGERILSFSTDMIKIWDVETGINIYTIEESFHGADFYQDSKHIITISGILKDTKVIIHDLDTGEIKPITGFQDFLGFKCSFSPNRALVATDMDTLWDITKGELQKKLAGDEYTTVGSERYFSPDSTLIASCSDHQVWINNVYGDDYMVLPEEHTDNVCAVSFSPADKNLVSASWDKTLKIWDIETISVLITLTGHTERVFTVAYSQDGKRIASGDEGGTIIIWNPETGEILKRFEGHLKSISSIQFSPDGKHIVSSSADKTIRLWDLEDHAELRQYNKTDTYSNLFEHIAVNPVENTLSYSLDNCLVLLNLETQSVFRAFCATEGNVNSFAFSSDGEKIITTSGKTLLLWNLKTGKLHRTFRGHHDEVFFVSFSIDGNRVVSTSVDKTLKIWDIKSGECIITKEVKAWMAIYSPDGHHLAYNNLNGEIIICDSDTCKVLRQISAANPNTFFSFCFSPHGDTIASLSCEGSICQWDVNTGRRIDHYIDLTNAQSSKLSGPISYSCDGKNIFFVSRNNTINVLDSNTKTLIPWFHNVSKKQKKNTIDGHEELRHRCDISCVAFSFNGKSIITSSSDRIVITDLLTKTVLHVIEKPRLNKIEKIAYLSDKKLIAIVYSGMNNLVIVRDYSMGRIVHLLIGHSQPINSVAFNQNGSRIVTTSDDGTVRIWDVDSGCEIRCLESSCELFESATFSPNGTDIVAVSSYNLRLFFKDPNSPPYIHRGYGMLKIDGNLVKVERKGKTLKLLGHTGRVNSALLSPDGNYVISASSDNEIKVWNIIDGELLYTLKGHRGSVNYAAYSCDGQYIISASDDSTVRMWNAQNGLLLKTFSCNESRLFTADISTNNKKIVAASTDNTIILWDIQDDSQMKLFNHCSQNRIVQLEFSIDCKYIGIHEEWGFDIIDISNGETSLLPVVRVWNYLDNTIVLNNYSHLKKVNSARFSANGREVVTASDDAMIRLFDSVTCKLTKTLNNKQVGLEFVCFDRYGNNVISIDYNKRLSIRRIDTGMMDSHIDKISNLYCISPDGKYISYVEEDRRIVICDIETNTVVQSIDPQYGYDSMTFSSDGNAIILTQYDSIFIWEFPPLQQLINDTRERFKNNPLTQAERKQFYLE